MYRKYCKGTWKGVRSEFMRNQFENTNRLIYEKSPYLLQHAHNPVDWYSWCEEAFESAKMCDKPIFLSIGYATCHWCHVMEQESFEDKEVAKLLNDAFVNIKVDREELPEVDSLYMEFAQSMMAGPVGWPLNLILTPNLQPFFAATYLPPREEAGMMGLVELIGHIQKVWNSPEREVVISKAQAIIEVFSESVHSKGNVLPDEGLTDDAIELFYKMTDPIYGGMRGAPKFPIAYQTTLLMRYALLKDDSRALFIAERTLDMMQRGGIYDHLGGGFCRYSVDERWMTPHFEKMLYDNGLLISAYLEIWKITKKELYCSICMEIIGYVLRDLKSPAGGFLSAEDADSEGVEGLFYTWTVKEIKRLLGKEDMLLFCEFFSVSEKGNFEGRNVLHTPKRAENFALEKHIPLDEFEAKIKDWKRILWQAREQKVHPFKDDKVLTSWNGLMIYALVEAGSALNLSSYVDYAVKAASFIKDYLWKNEVLFRRWREGDVHFNGGLEDYAFLIRALLSLFEAGCGLEWLEWSLELTEILALKFKAQGGGFFRTDGTDPSLLIRNCHFSDGAEPSGNAIHCENLIRLYQITCEPHFLEAAGDILMAAKKYIEHYPLGYVYHILNLQRFYDRLAPTIVIALNKMQDFRKEIFCMIFNKSIPHRMVIWREEENEELFRLIPFVKGYAPMNGNTTVYICRNRVCEKPLTDFGEIEKVLFSL